MCDPVSCEKCRNVAGCKEAQARAETLSGLYDNTVQQVERLASLKSEPERRVSGQTEAMEHPLVGENRHLRASLRELQDQLADLHSTNIGLMDSNRQLTQFLRAIQLITDAAP